MVGFNWVLIVIIVILAILSVGVALYLLIAYQHPEDKNQAWFPKLVVLVGITLSIWTVLLFPLDIANRSISVSKIQQGSLVVESPCLATAWLRVQLQAYHEGLVREWHP